MFGLDGFVPAQIAGGVRVGATENGIVVAGHAVIARVLPANRPTIDWAGAVVGYSYFSCKSIAPLVFNNVLATSIGVGGERGYCQGKPCCIEGAC